MYTTIHADAQTINKNTVYRVCIFLLSLSVTVAATSHHTFSLSSTVILSLASVQQDHGTLFNTLNTPAHHYIAPLVSMRVFGKKVLHSCGRMGAGNHQALPSTTARFLAFYVPKVRWLRSIYIVYMCIC